MSLATPQQSSTSPGASAAPASGSVDNLTCQWQGCTQPNHPSPEALYEHVCETHIGRKSTNNLNLQCFWGACRTTTVKRDHITSHIRVHVPLKPHKCDFCGKSFKRPQDLKKHVKTHADESVLMNSPAGAPGPGARGQPNGYHGPGNPKSSGFYDGAGMGPNNMNYGHGGYPAMQNGFGHYNGGPGGMQNPGYGVAHYGFQPPMSSYTGLTESRKRTHDALNEFFGEVKRRNVDPHTYQDLGARFGTLLSMMGPMAPAFQTGFNTGYNSGMDQNAGGVAYQTAQHPPMMQPGYGMSFPELRTKNDLLSIDQFLEQLQNTAYENPADTAAAGMQPVSTMVHVDYPPSGNPQHRGSRSPPRYASSADTPSSYTASQSADMEDTLTPPSTHHTQSPAQRSSGSFGYPSLPSISSLDHQSNQFAQGSTSAVPPSNLGQQYEDYHNQRRYSATLQRERPAPTTRDREDDKTTPSPKLPQAGKDASTTSPKSNVKLPSIMQLTGEAGPTSPTDRKSSEREGERERDVRKSGSPEGESAASRNRRMIQGLLHYIRARLERGEYEGGSSAGSATGSESGKTTPRPGEHAEASPRPEHPTEDNAGNGSDTEMVDADASSEHGSTPKREGPSIAYPTLPKMET